MRLCSCLVAVAACSTSGGTHPTPPSWDSPPQILSLAANTTMLDEHGTLVITAVVTDPNGIDDVIGGTLLDPDSGSAYGAFDAAGSDGTYELDLAWHDIEAVQPIDTPIGGAERDFLAQFFDQGGHLAQQTISVTLHCSMSGYALCSGTCADLASDPHNCGACGKVIADGASCQGGNACVLGPEDTPEACSDGCSNDGDPYVDCNDYDCCGVVDCAKGTTCNP